MPLLVSWLSSLELLSLLAVVSIYQQLLPVAREFYVDDLVLLWFLVDFEAELVEPQPMMAPDSRLRLLK